MNKNPTKKAFLTKRLFGVYNIVVAGNAKKTDT